MTTGQKVNVRARRWRELVRQDLLELMGERCAFCGSTDDLTFDHLRARDWKLEKVGSVQRMRIFRKEFWAGKLQLLCRSCNSRKGHPPEAVQECAE